MECCRETLTITWISSTTNTWFQISLALSVFFICPLTMIWSFLYLIHITLNPNKSFTNYYLSLLDDCLAIYFKGKIKAVMLFPYVSQYMYLHDNYFLFVYLLRTGYPSSVPKVYISMSLCYKPHFLSWAHDPYSISYLFVCSIFKSYSLFYISS